MFPYNYKGNCAILVFLTTNVSHGQTSYIGLYYNNLLSFVRATEDSPYEAMMQINVSVWKEPERSHII